MPGYGQHCPVAKAAEVFDGRWTLLVLRELVAGSDRFNDIHRGVPRMSRTLLSKRLRELERDGIVERREEAEGPVYALTGAGAELLPVIESIGEWGIRWMNDLDEDDLDPAFLLWDMHRSVDRTALPDERTVLELNFPDAPHGLRQWWLLLTPDEVDVCDDDPGFDPDVYLCSPLRTFIRVWSGDLDWADACGPDGIQTHGNRQLCRALPTWFTLSHFSSVPRPTPMP